MKRNFIDVGASYGTFSKFMSNQSKLGKEISVVAIEPIPEVAQQIEKASNLKIINRAVAKKGISSKMLNITSNSELSSFNNINSKISESIWIHHMPHMNIVETLEVPCITLEEIIEENFSDHIDFVKIDTQGTDLETLLSAGKNLKRIKSAMLEFPYLSGMALYENEISLVDAIIILKKHNFVPVRLVPNGAGECNLFVVNADFTFEEYFDLEEECNFLEAPTLKLQQKKVKNEVIFKKLFKLLLSIKYLHSNK
jgi:FkbM family methyltransferase